MMVPEEYMQQFQVRTLPHGGSKSIHRYMNKHRPRLPPGRCRGQAGHWKSVLDSWLCAEPDQGRPDGDPSWREVDATIPQERPTSMGGYILCAVVAPALTFTADSCALVASACVSTAVLCAVVAPALTFTADSCALIASVCVSVADSCAFVTSALAFTADPCAFVALVFAFTGACSFTAAYTCWTERQRHCSDGQRTPGSP